VLEGLETVAGRLKRTGGKVGPADGREEKTGTTEVGRVVETGGGKVTETGGGRVTEAGGGRVTETGGGRVTEAEGGRVTETGGRVEREDVLPGVDDCAEFITHRTLPAVAKQSIMEGLIKPNRMKCSGSVPYTLLWSH